MSVDSTFIQDPAQAPPQPPPCPPTPTTPFLYLMYLSNFDLSLSTSARLSALSASTPRLLKVGIASHLPLHQELTLSYGSGSRAQVPSLTRRITGWNPGSATTTSSATVGRFLNSGGVSVFPESQFTSGSMRRPTRRAWGLGRLSVSQCPYTLCWERSGPRAWTSPRRCFRRSWKVRH